MTSQPESHSDDLKSEQSNSLIFWNSAVLGLVLASGLLLWSQAGSAVFFDRISGAIAGCF